MTVCEVVDIRTKARIRFPAPLFDGKGLDNDVTLEASAAFDCRSVIPLEGCVVVVVEVAVVVVTVVGTVVLVVVVVVGAAVVVVDDVVVDVLVTGDAVKVATSALQLVLVFRPNVPAYEPSDVAAAVSVAARDVAVSCARRVYPLPAVTVPM